MDDKPKMGAEMWKRVKRGVGWALGVGTVVSAAALLRDGPRPTITSAIKAGMRGREVVAELTEQMQDLYPEAQAERVAEPPAADG